jgi:cytochrome P450
LAALPPAIMKLVDFATPEFYQNPFPLYAKLRAAGPLVPIGPNAMMTGHFDVVEKLLLDRHMMRDPKRSARARYGEDKLDDPIFQGFHRMLFVLNPPDHTRLRSLIMKAFNARQVDSLRELARTTAERLIDGFADARTVDLVPAFAWPYPVEIISAMMDVPRERNLPLAQALKHIVAMFDPAPVDAQGLAKANDAYRMLERYFGEIVDARRGKPGADLISLLIGVEEDNETLTHDEIVANVIGIYLAGHESTSHMIGNALIALQLHPQQFDALKRDMTKLPNAVLESLRYNASAHLATRTASEDREIEGIAIPRNTIVYLSLGAANRDPAKFDNPDRFEIDREPARAISFGGGIHHCLGYRLALLELETALGVLLTRLPGLTVSGLDALRWLPTANVRGVEELTAHW